MDFILHIRSINYQLSTFCFRRILFQKDIREPNVKGQVDRRVSGATVAVQGLNRAE